MSDQRHKTIGISFHPELRQRAAQRAQALGLAFSRYVALCVESDLGDRSAPWWPEVPTPAGQGGAIAAGRGVAILSNALSEAAGSAVEASEGSAGAVRPPPQRRGLADEFSLDEAIELGGEYGLAKARSIAFEEDIEEILRAEDFCYERLAPVAHLRTDFLIQHAAEGRDRPMRVALECKGGLRGRYALTLGQLLVLRSLPSIDAVLLCIPYTRNFDPHVRETFRQQGLPIVTPDTLVETLHEMMATFDRQESGKDGSGKEGL